MARITPSEYMGGRDPVLDGKGHGAGVQVRALAQGTACLDGDPAGPARGGEVPLRQRTGKGPRVGADPATAAFTQF
ncbi:hypothetical protein [Arthrobacter sp.]|uniref:hypothetical protein n=1 Tax=Arthrobacter sp. TaxID=1667 RepID=UPI002811D4FA|nr:hypothetical protein [Arthrobacter sp.]